MILDACPACSRPYDVSHLSPGCELRCLCERVFVVRHRARHVAALACRRCGGAVRVQDERCPYCAAGIPLEERTAKLCPRCLARAPESAKHCPACATSLTPQALAPLPEDQRCPRCRGFLRLRMLDGASATECRSCEGLWLAAEDFERVCRNAREDPDAILFATRDALPASPLPVGSRAYVPCLACGELMFRRQFHHGRASSRVIVDACRAHGIWLDRDELERVVAFLRGRRASERRAEAGVFPALSGEAPAPTTDGTSSVPLCAPRPSEHPVLEALSLLARLFTSRA